MTLYMDTKEMTETRAPEMADHIALAIDHLNAYYGSVQAVHDVTVPIVRHSTMAIIGPSGCGKSTVLRCLNRMHEVVPRARITGRVLLEGQNLYDTGVDPVRVLEVGSDVGIRMLERGRGLHARYQRDPAGEVPLRRDSRRRGRDDVGAERQLRVDVGLLVVGGGEDAEAHAKREQQSDHHKAAVDSGAAPAGADGKEPPRVPASRPPLERMLRIHQTIQSGSFPNASTLAAQLEVSTKSVHRDLEFMRDRLQLPRAMSIRRWSMAAPLVAPGIVPLPPTGGGIVVQ